MKLSTAIRWTGLRLPRVAPALGGYPLVIWGLTASTPGMHMRRHLYEIVVEGDLRAADREWLADLAIHRSAGRRTALFGYLDQSALLGVLKRLQYLALEVCGVRRMCGCAADRASWPSREMASAASPAGASRGVADQMSGVNP